MRNIYIILFLLISLSACSKMDDHWAVPQQPIEASTSGHTAITQLSGYARGDTIHLSFSYSGDLSQVAAFRIYSGADGHQLCAIGEIPVSQTSSKAFSFTDSHPKADPTYYLIGIIDTEGHITYDSPLISVPLQGTTNTHS